MQSWGIRISIVEVPRVLQLIALLFWVCGFASPVSRAVHDGGFLSSRDTPKEDTRLRTDGLFRLSRNPMYVGVYQPLLHPPSTPLNPVVILLGVFVIAVHHRIVLAEENHLQKVFGREYLEYCSRVRQYI